MNDLLNTIVDNKPIFIIVLSCAALIVILLIVLLIVSGKKKNKKEEVVNTGVSNGDILPVVNEEEKFDALNVPAVDEQNHINQFNNIEETSALERTNIVEPNAEEQNQDNKPINNIEMDQKENLNVGTIEPQVEEVKEEPVLENINEAIPSVFSVADSIEQTENNNEIVTNESVSDATETETPIEVSSELETNESTVDKPVENIGFPAPEVSIQPVEEPKDDVTVEPIVEEKIDNSEIISNSVESVELPKIEEPIFNEIEEIPVDDVVPEKKEEDIEEIIADEDNIKSEQEKLLEDLKKQKEAQNHINNDMFSVLEDLKIK